MAFIEKILETPRLRCSSESVAPRLSIEYPIATAIKQARIAVSAFAKNVNLAEIRRYSNGWHFFAAQNLSGACFRVILNGDERLLAWQTPANQCA